MSEKVLNGALNLIKPNKEEEKEVSGRINSFLKQVNTGLKGAKAILGGSGSKGTWLKDAHDADIFVQFNYDQFKDKSDQLSDILEKHLKKKFKIIRLHGSRDYFQVKEKNALNSENSGNTGGVFTFEIVPVLKISKAEQALNITDVSLLHSVWVNKHKKYADDIRLMKQFCKAQGVYGAESYLKGFSGYICEILVINYKGFMKLVRAASKWKPQTILDFKKYYKNKKDILFNLNKSKITGPLVLVDPVQKTRNAAAALNHEKYDDFIRACKSFLSKPSKKSFEIKEIKDDDLRKKAGKNKLILIKAESLEGKPDVTGSKLLKVVEFLNQKLAEKEFKIHNHGWKWDKEKYALIWFIVDKKALDIYFIREGPPSRAKIYVDYFKKRHPKKTFVKKGRIYAREKRAFRDPSKFIEFLIKDEYVKDKVREIVVE